MIISFLFVVISVIVSTKIVVDGFSPLCQRRVRSSSSRSSLLLSTVAPLTSRTKEYDTTIIIHNNDNINNMKLELKQQHSNEDAQPYDLTTSLDLRYDLKYVDEGCINPVDNNNNIIIHHDHFEFRSFDDLFPGLNFSDKFDTCTEFRDDLRMAIRTDIIFDDISKPSIYSYLSHEKRHEELRQNSPMIGFWKCNIQNDNNNKNSTVDDNKEVVCNSSSSNSRMKRTTKVLKEYLGPMAPTGDKFMETIGNLCDSPKPPFAWTEVVGIRHNNRKEKHAWHQDYGRLLDDSNNKIVFLGWPPENKYNGLGVFPHLIKLKKEQWVPLQNRKPEIFYEGNIPEKYIVRPQYRKGREVIMMRDIDVLHSSPDLLYRTSLMRFG